MTRPTANTPSILPWVVIAFEGQAHGLQFAEVFHYVGPDEPDIGDYARRYAVPL